jgi:signal transduction histidine kinase
MIPIFREWFIQNKPLVYFVYGQVFFILGLAISLRSRQYSRLNLARSLPWLAGFGFIHGLNEWGDLFMPLQRQFLSDPILSILSAAQHLFLGVSFALLMQFGVELLRPLPKNWHWLRLLPAGIFMLWLIGAFWFGLGLIQDVETWHTTVDVLARYGLCLPASLVSAYGLLHQTRLQIQPLGLPRIGRMLQIAAGALAAYAILGGLIVPATSFFPANALNVDTFTRIMIAPPPVFRSIAGLVLVVAVIRALDVFDIETERLIRQMEENQVIAIERERIARDLHDGALQQVYAAGLLAQTLTRQAKGSIADSLERLVLTINQAIDQLRAFLPQLQPEPRSIELVPALETVIEEARRAIPVETKWSMEKPIVLTPEQTSHLVAFAREALSNSIRHAQTRRIEFTVACVDGHVQMVIRDFGSGFSSSYVTGYGLRNMHDRARLLGASINIESTPNKGTRVTLDLPVEELHATHTPVDRG